MKKVGIILNIWRLLIPMWLYWTDAGFRSIMQADLRRIPGVDEPSLYSLLDTLAARPVFRANLYLRMGKHKILRKIQKWMLPVKTMIEVSGDIQGGFVIYHGHAAVISCESAGENFSVYQNVTVGRNKSHISKTGAIRPVIGHHVSLYPGCVVAGGITIGNHVEIAANAVVLNDVPDNCLVVGNPARIKRLAGERVDIPLSSFAKTQASQPMPEQDGLAVQGRPAEISI